MGEVRQPGPPRGRRAPRIRLRWPAPGDGTARILAAAGAAWSALFAAAHFYWASGGRAGVPGTAAPIGDRPLFLAYDLAAGVVFTAAAGAGIILARTRDDRPPPAWLVTAVTWGSVLSLLYGAGGLIKDMTTLAAGHAPGTGIVYDLWFATAGMLFLTAARGLRPQRRRRPDERL